jgi:signal transduction histidine kinase
VSSREEDRLATMRPDMQVIDVATRGRLLGSVRYRTSAQRPLLLRAVLREAHLPLELARSRLELRRALAEVEESRTRLVKAGDAERRRIERDLHDGAQQHLVAIGMSLRLAQQRVPSSDPVHPVLVRAIHELQEAISELRRLAGGVRPRGLDEGLHSAIRGLVRASPTPITVNVTTGPLAEELSTTAYYVAAEAVTNALKHAEPNSVHIEVTRVDGVVRVLVADDGRGGAEVVAGGGLAGLRDRVLANGGQLLVRSRPDHGTEIEAQLPCAS